MTSLLTRRELLAGLAGFGVSTLVSGRLQSAQAPAAGPRRIDVHHHFGSPRWRKRVAEVQRPGWQQFVDWEPAKAIDAMDKAGVATAMLSCTEPGVWFGDEFEKERADAISLSRDMNEFGARMVSDHKGRFGLFAVLPLPDVDASLKEIEYAFDTLRADGVGLLTSYGYIWPGDARLRPVFDELNRRKAVVYSHPTDGPCCHNLAGATPVTMEWFTDTTRAILSIIAEEPAGGGGGAAGGGAGRGAGGAGRGAGGAGRGAGGGAPAGVSAATRYPNITFIWSHAGGTLLGAVSRVVTGVSAENLAKPAAMNSRLYHVRRFYYDTAASGNPIAMQGMKHLLGGTSQIVFGSDYPYGGTPPIASLVRDLETVGFTAEELRGVDRENALRILPKYRTA
jgi:predicted TIM-barrel fold metal-dependent hydrolase